MSMTDEQTIVLEMVKDWLETNDVNVLAAEQVVVQWSSVDGSTANLGWLKTPLKEIVSILKGTTIPMQLMKHMNIDMLMGAAQESERIYERGVTVYGECLPQFLNYAERRKLSAHELLIKEVIKLSLETKTNVDGVCVYNAIDKAMAKSNIDLPTSVARNRIIDSFKNELHFKHRYGANRLQLTKRVNEKQKKFTCIQIPTLRTEPVYLDDKTEDEWAAIAIRRALIK